MDSFLFKRMEQYDYENLFFCQEQHTGLKAVIAIHSTALGPAAGGTRMWTYATEQEAIIDAMRLARAMTYKMAAIGAPFGGGKCVLIGDPRRDKSEALLRSLARFVHRLGGLFLTGVDVGITTEDALLMSQETPFIVKEAGGPGLGESGTATAFGVIQGMRACLKTVYGSPDLKGHSVVVQGVGSVGREVVHRLVEAGALVSVSDLNQEALEQIRNAYDVAIVPAEAVYQQQVDVYSPCALGAVVNDETVPQLQCRIICGSANNQLAEERHGDLLTQRGILYAPDYIVNAGGALTHLDTFHPDGFNEQRVATSIARIYDTVERVIAIAQQQQVPTYRAADLLAEERLTAARIHP